MRPSLCTPVPFITEQQKQSLLDLHLTRVMLWLSQSGFLINVGSSDWVCGCDSEGPTRLSCGSSHHRPFHSLLQSDAESPLFLRTTMLTLLKGLCTLFLQPIIISTAPPPHRVSSSAGVSQVRLSKTTPPLPQITLNIPLTHSLGTRDPS